MGDALNTNVPLLPFEEIKGIFDRQIILRNQWGYPEESVISRRLIIDHVELSYMKVRKPNDDKEFIYLPVWDFHGKLMAKYGDDYPTGTEGFNILDENNEHVEIGNMEELASANYLSFLTINAIDGSIIDRNMGY